MQSAVSLEDLDGDGHLELVAGAWLGDGSRVVVACTDGQVRVVDPSTVKVTGTIPALEGWAYTLAVHPSDGSILVAGQDGQIRRRVLSREAIGRP